MWQSCDFVSTGKDQHSSNVIVIIKDCSHYQGGGGGFRQIVCEMINLIQVNSSSKTIIFAIFWFSSFTIDFTICLHFVPYCSYGIFWWHFSHSPKLWENYLNAENLNEVQSSFLTKYLVGLQKQKEIYYISWIWLLKQIDCLP